MTDVLIVGGSLLLGFLFGVFSFRLKQRWCPICGATLTCPYPAHHDTSRAV